MPSEIEQNGMYGPDEGEMPPSALDMLAGVDTSDPAEFVTELSASSDFFQAESVAHILVKGRTYAFKIRSVPKSEIEDALRELKPRSLPKVLDKKTKTYVEDTESRAYLHWIGTFGYLKVLLGLSAMTLRDRRGEIVWQVPGEVRKLDVAVQALKDTGITVEHVEKLTAAINALSAQEDEQQTEELLGNFGGD